MHHSKNGVTSKMTLYEVVEKLDLDVRSAKEKCGVEIQGGYVSDLLSDVMANSRKGDLWITLQIHQNIIAVATLKELAGIILVNGKVPPQETLMKAEEEGVPLLISPMTAYETVCRLYELGVSGKR
jgi:hypothetical protein